MSKHYTIQEDDIIKQYYPIKTPKEMIVLLPERKLSSIRQRAEMLEIRNKKSWKNEDIEFLKANYEYGAWEELVKKLHRAKSTICAYARKFKLVKRTKPNCKWDAKDEEYLKTHYATTNNQLLSEHLNKSISALTSEAYKFKLYKEKSYRNEKYSKWTEKQIEYVTQNFGKIPVKDMCKYLDKTDSSIFNKLTRLGLLIRNKRGVSTLEDEFKKLLYELGVQFETQYKLKQYRCDFKIDNLLIELQGTFWHADSRIYKDPKYTLQKNAIRRDAAKKKLILKLGYKYAQIWEYDFYNNKAKIEADLKAVISGDIDEYNSAKSVNISKRKHRGKA